MGKAILGTGTQMLGPWEPKTVLSFMSCYKGHKHFKAETFQQCGISLTGS